MGFGKRRVKAMTRAQFEKAFGGNFQSVDGGATRYQPTEDGVRVMTYTGPSMQFHGQNAKFARIGDHLMEASTWAKLFRKLMAVKLVVPRPGLGRCTHVTNAGVQCPRRVSLTDDFCARHALPTGGSQ